METSQPFIKFDTYIRKVLKQVHPDSRIDSNALSQLNSFINVLAFALAEKASMLANNAITGSPKKHILDSRALQTAVSLLLPGELGKHGISEANKALAKYSKKGGKSISRETRAGLVFSVSRTEKIIREVHRGKIGSNTPIYLAAILEYITAEITELSGNAANDNKRATISARDLTLCFRNDEELDELAEDLEWNVLGGGVLPNIHAYLLPKNFNQYEDSDDSDDGY